MSVTDRDARVERSQFCRAVQQKSLMKQSASRECLESDGLESLVFVRETHDLANDRKDHYRFKSARERASGSCEFVPSCYTAPVSHRSSS